MRSVQDKLDETGRILASTPQLLAVMLSAVDEDVLTSRPAPGEWSILEVIGHLIETDKHAFGGRVELILAEERPVLPGWDMLAAVSSRRDNERRLVSLLEEFSDVRQGYVKLVGGLQLRDLNRPCVHRVGELTLGDFVFEWPFHDHNHIGQIAANIRVTFLPFMGELMRQALA